MVASEFRPRFEEQTGFLFTVLELGKGVSRRWTRQDLQEINVKGDDQQELIAIYWSRHCEEGGAKNDLE